MALLAPALGGPGVAIGSPDTATPSSGSPAGTEYGIPFAQGRQAGGGGGSHHGGGLGGSIGGGSGGGTGSAGGGGGSSSLATLFGAGIRPARASHGGPSSTSSGGPASGSSASGGDHHGASNAVRDVVTSARAVADKAAADAGSADWQVALIVGLLLVTGGALAVALRFAVRRSAPPGAA